jgi:hypothetical protein
MNIFFFIATATTNCLFCKTQEPLSNEAKQKSACP